MNFRIVSEVSRTFDETKVKLKDICLKCNLNIYFSDSIIYGKNFPNGFLDFSIKDLQDNLCIYGTIYEDELLEKELIVRDKFVYDLVEAEFFYESLLCHSEVKKFFFNNVYEIFDNVLIEDLDEQNILNRSELT